MMTSTSGTPGTSNSRLTCRGTHSPWQALLHHWFRYIEAKCTLCKIIRYYIIIIMVKNKKRSLVGDFSRRRVG